MAAKTIKKHETVIWLPPRSVGERVFASEPRLLAMVHSADGSRYARLSLDTLPKVRSATLVVDARDVTLLPASLPPLSGARLRQAVPNVVEDSLLQDPQGCSFGIGPVMEDGRRMIAVVDKAWLEFVVGAVERRGIRVARAVPAQLALPFEPGVATLACLHDGLAVRTGPLQGIGWGASDEEDFRTEAVSAALATVLAPPVMRRPFDPLNPSTGTFSTPQASRSADDNDTAPADVPPEVPAADEPVGYRAERLVACIEDDSWTGPVELVAGRLRLPVQFQPLPVPDTSVMNLLDGQASATWTRRLADVDWRAWQLPAALATGGLAAFLIGLNLHWAKLSTERNELNDAMRATLKSSLSVGDVPGDKADYMGKQLRIMRSTAGQSGPDDFVPLVNRFSRALGPQANDALTGMEYRDGYLQVSFRPAVVRATAARRNMQQACKRLGLSLTFDSDQNPTSARVQVL